MTHKLPPVAEMTAEEMKRQGQRREMWVGNVKEFSRMVDTDIEQARVILDRAVDKYRSRNRVGCKYRSINRIRDKPRLKPRKTRKPHAAFYPQEPEQVIEPVPARVLSVYDAYLDGQAVTVSRLAPQSYLGAHAYFKLRALAKGKQGKQGKR